MGALFASASTQYVSNAAFPAITYPFTVGCWVNWTSAVDGEVWSFSDTATLNNYYSMRPRFASGIRIVARGGGTENIGEITTVPTAGAWHYIICRFISATNRRISAIYPTGAALNAQTTTSRTATGIDMATVGALRTSGGVSSPTDGTVAEWWYTATDIQADAAALGTELLFQLAYQGPFSIPHVAAAVVEYRGFREGIDSITDHEFDVYWGPGANGRTTWTQSASPIISHHPPLPYQMTSLGSRARTIQV